MGYVNKLYRGLSRDWFRPGEPEATIEKPWIAAVETYAIGGACQLLHVMDHVIAQRGARLFLPARREGIIAGASNLRLARSVGDRVARRAILSGMEFVAGEASGDLLCDEIVEAGEMDAAVAARVDALSSSGLINAAANRRVMRIGEEPLGLFATYMAAYAREQAQLGQSPGPDRQSGGTLERPRAAAVNRYRRGGCSKSKKETVMQQYVILRRSGWSSPDELQEAAGRSSRVGDVAMSDDIRWIRSYVLAEDAGSVGTVCIYEASSPEAIREHGVARRSAGRRDHPDCRRRRSCGRTRWPPAADVAGITSLPAPLAPVARQPAGVARPTDAR